MVSFSNSKSNLAGLWFAAYSDTLYVAYSDTLCSNYLKGVQYASSDIGGVDRLNCSNLTCEVIETYAESFSAIENSKCVNCTSGPI